MKEAVIEISKIVFLIFGLSAVVGIFLYFIIDAILHLEEYLDIIKKFILSIFNYRYKINYYIEEYEKIDDEKFIPLIECIENYKELIIAYNINKPTKVGKAVLIRLYKSLKVFKLYLKYSSFEKSDDLFKVSDLNKVIDEEIKSLIEIINSDILIIKQKGLNDLIKDVKNLYK